MRCCMGLSAGLGIALSLTLSGCNKEAVGEQKREPPKVTVATPVVKNVTNEAEFTGEVIPKEKIEIRARVEGVLDNVYFEDGVVVTKGDKLFLIEQAPYRAKLAAATAQVARSKAAEKLTKDNRDRLKKLYDKRDGTVTIEEYETAVAEYDAAVAQVAADKASEEQAGIQLSYTAIRAPITGLMSRSLVDKGNLVGAGENTLLATIVQMNPIDVQFDVPEDVVLKYLEKRREMGGANSEPTPFYVGLKNEIGYPHKGGLDYIDNEIDRETGGAIVRGTVPNGQGFLYSGQFARVKVPLEEIKNAINVDEQAIGTDLGGRYLLVVGEKNIVEQRPVVVGPLINGMRVIREGLKADEQYIVEGLQRARPGLPVNPQTADEAAQEIAATKAAMKKTEKPAEASEPKE